jgi:tripartite-type tricarboxylate transporter receptor subunit TctC
MQRRALLLASLSSLATCTTLPALAQDNYPTKAVKIVNNFPPGGPADVLARSLGQVLADRFKQPFIVENKPGAGGNIGADAVAKSSADGYTVLFGIDTTFTVNPHIYGKSMPFKTGDLKPLIILASSGMTVAVNPASGIKSMKDFFATGKGKGLNLSSAGSGAPGHLAAEVLSDAVPGIKITHIPYKGNTPAVSAILAGEVDGGVLATPGLVPYIKAGKITGLAVTSSRRSSLAPDLPTVVELGLKELQQEILYVAMVPAATPDAVLQSLQQVMAEGLKRADIQTRLAALDMVVEGQTGAAAQKRLAELSERYAKTVRATGMKVD